MIMDKIMKNIYNHFDWNEIRILKIERKSRYGDCKWMSVDIYILKSIHFFFFYFYKLKILFH